MNTTTPTSTPTSSSARTIRLVLLALLTTVTLVGVGCRGDRSANRPRQIFPDMDDQPKAKPQTKSAFFEDGRQMREPVEGAVPFGVRAEVSYAHPDARRTIRVERADLLEEDDRFYTGLEADGSPVLSIPMRQTLALEDNEPLTSADVASLIARGRENYEILCIVCHGGSGDGDGMVGQRWAAPIPSYHQPQYRAGGEKGQDGHLFYTIMNGLPNAEGVLPELRMPAYGNRVTEREAWAIVAYVRALQRSRGDVDTTVAAGSEEATR